LVACSCWYGIATPGTPYVRKQKEKQKQKGHGKIEKEGEKGKGGGGGLGLTWCIIAFVMASFFVALGRLVWNNCFFRIGITWNLIGRGYFGHSIALLTVSYYKQTSIIQI